jgi:Icc-related predicted phosphoesterase
MQIRTPKTVVVTHYAPIAATVQGEPAEILPYLGTSRLAEVVDRHGAELVVHGHAHHGCPDGKTTGGVPVHNVSLPLNMKQNPPRPYRVFDV